MFLLGAGREVLESGTKRQMQDLEESYGSYGMNVAVLNEQQYQTWKDRCITSKQDEEYRRRLDETLKKKRKSSVMNSCNVIFPIEKKDVKLLVNRTRSCFENKSIYDICTSCNVLMFYIIRSYRQSWLLLVPAVAAALFVYLKENVDDWPDFLDDSVATVVGAATGLLAFILSLNLNTALTRNADGNANFNAFCGDVLAFGMFVCGLTVDDKEDEEKFETVRNNIRDLLLAAPQVCKWTFRDGVDVDLIAVRLKGRTSDGQRMSEKLYERNKKMYCLLKQYYDIGAMEAVMLALGNEMQNLTAMKTFGEDNAFTLH